MMQRTQGYFDTCRCHVTYEWDDTVRLNQRVHTLVSIRKCAVHAALSDSVAYDQVMNKENALKNGALAEIATRLAIPEEDLKFRLADTTRQIVVIVPPDRRAAAAALNTILDTRFGNAKVRTE